MKDYTIVLTGSNNAIQFICTMIEDSIIETRSKSVEEFMSIFNKTVTEDVRSLFGSSVDSILNSMPNNVLPCNHVSLLAYLCCNSPESALCTMQCLTGMSVFIGCSFEDYKCTLYCSSDSPLDSFFSSLVASSDFLDSYSIQEGVVADKIYIHFCCAKTALKFTRSIISLSLFDRGYCPLQLLAETFTPFDGNFHKLALNQTIRKFTDWEGGLLFEGNLMDPACGFFDALSRYSPYVLGFTKSPRYDDSEPKQELNALNL